MLGEIQAARALLAPVLALESDPSVRAAEAFLGALELRLGAPERAVGFLRKATETADDWPGRADAEANLGLALLSLGQDKEGLRWLHVAQARYEAGRDWDGLVQALRNELRWAERSGRTVEAERVRKSLALLEGP
jgi:tetratricopeptide (TPR) repeat protein